MLYVCMLYVCCMSCMYDVCLIKVLYIYIYVTGLELSEVGGSLLRCGMLSGKICEDQR